MTVNYASIRGRWKLGKRSQRHRSGRFCDRGGPKFSRFCRCRCLLTDAKLRDDPDRRRPKVVWLCYVWRRRACGCAISFGDHLVSPQHLHADDRRWSDRDDRRIEHPPLFHPHPSTLPPAPPYFQAVPSNTPMRVVHHHGFARHTTPAT
jgi:hypothetical protein